MAAARMLPRSRFRFTRSRFESCSFDVGMFTGPGEGRRRRVRSEPCRV